MGKSIARLFTAIPQALRRVRRHKRRLATLAPVIFPIVTLGKPLESRSPLCSVLLTLVYWPEVEFPNGRPLQDLARIREGRKRGA